jgi:metallo-beta-lactamase class B
MMAFYYIYYMKTLFVVLTFLVLGNLTAQTALTPNEFKPIEVYHSDNLIIIQIAENTFLHTSYLQTNDFGNVPCNGMIVRNSTEVVVFDTPTNNKSADELINFIKEKLHCTINAIVPTHFHDDCLGGLAAFHLNKIPSFGNKATIQLAKKNKVEVPQNGFDDSLRLNIGNTHAVVKYFGQGHTKDNVIGYFPSEDILFGGCLIKELEATKGYLGDANVLEWSNTVMKIKQQYPTVKVIIPGHGQIGGKELLDYTIQLFKSN